MALHEQSLGSTDEWYTPPGVFKALDVSFDLDVASPGVALVPWIPAARHLTKADAAEWAGFIWMNPPFGGRNGIAPWLAHFFDHGQGIALTPDRTSAPWWQLYARQADAILFVSPKIKFIAPDGQPGRSPAQGTSLMAVGVKAIAALENARRSGLGILLKAAE